MLNADQRRIFDGVKSHLLHQQQHEANECHCNFKPLRMFVSGVGGTGKSFLIEAIKALVASIWPSDSLTCAVAAPTGLAAFYVGGITIHRLFQLPIETLRHVKMIVIDEVSMVSSLNLAYMHLRLEELFGGNEWFGSKNVLFVGGLLQLPPVSGKPVFDRITTNPCYSNWGVQRLLTFGEIPSHMTNSPSTSAREKTKSFHQCWIV